MKCPDCSFENERDARFCQNCGRPLEYACPNCGTPNAASARFCKNCGFNLANRVASASTGALSALRQAMPDTLQEKIQSARARGTGERKLVTVLFSDIVNSTGLAERMDPEEWGRIMSGAYQRVSQVVYHYEGMIAQLQGDGVLAFFGAPITHEDDPRRAIHAAVDILDSMVEYRRWLRSEGLVDNLQMRIGLNTGIVVVGDIGSDLHMEYLAIGDTVNLAARIQTAADPNTVLVAENTYRLVTSLFDFEDRGVIQVKGKAEPVHAYRVLGEHKGAVQSRGVTGLSSPMVGRSREMATLMQVVANARSGRGSIVSVIGEAGLGKSRLMAEWRQNALQDANHPLRWVVGRCLSYGASMPFHLGTSVLRGLIGAGPDASESDTRAALWKTTGELFGSEMRDIYPYLGYLLGVQLEPEMENQVKDLEGAALQSRYIAATKRFLRAIAQSTPTVIVYEDIHWADISSVDLGLQILPLVAEAPLVSVFVTRPEPQAPGWRLVTQADDFPGAGSLRLYLSPLAEGDSQQLVSNLLGIDSLPGNICQPILSKAEGNPFFVEEVIRMLIDRRGLIRLNRHWEATRDLQRIEIPDTLLGVLMARIDRLPEGAKRALQIASVIGRTFEVELLNQVLDQDQRAALAGHLALLEASGLVRPTTREGGEKYRLRHALVQDAAYESLLKQDRRQLHIAVAEAIEHLHADRLDEYAVYLAQHYVEAGDDANTFKYSHRAGDAANRLYASAEARLQYARALDAISRLPDDEANRRCRVDLQTSLVSVAWVADDPKVNLQRLLQAEKIMKTLPPPESNEGTLDPTGDRLRFARLHYWMGRAYYLLNSARDAIGYYRQVLEEAKELGDEQLLAIPSAWIGQAMLVQGQFGQAAPLLAQAIAPLEKTGNLIEWIRALGFYGISLATVGHYAEAFAQGQRALARAQEIGNATGVALGHIYLACIYMMGRQSSKMLAEARDVVTVATQSGDRLLVYLGLGFQGWAEGRLGRYDASVEWMAQSRKLGQSLGGRLLLSDWFDAARAEIALQAGQVEPALALAEEAVNTAKAANALFGQGLAQRTWAQALAQLEPPRWDEVDEHMTESQHVLETTGARLEAARTQIAWSKMCRERGDMSSARAHLDQAIEWLADSGLTDELEETRRLKATMEPSTNISNDRIQGEIQA